MLDPIHPPVADSVLSHLRKLKSVRIVKRPGKVKDFALLREFRTLVIIRDLFISRLVLFGNPTKVDLSRISLSET